MSFIAKNPLIIPEIKHTPSTPPGTRGIFATKDGLYEVDSNNNVTLISENGGGSGNVDLSNYYTKDETTQLVDSKISSVYKYCGSVETVDVLPNQTLGEGIGNTYNVIEGTNVNTFKIFNCQLIGQTIDWIERESGLIIKDNNGKNISHLFLSGTKLSCTIDGASRSITLKRFDGEKWFVPFYGDVGWDGFNISKYESPINCDDGDNVAWTGYAWDNLGNKVDLSNYYTKQEIDIKKEQITSEIINATKETETYFNKVILNEEETYSSAPYYSVKATQKYMSDELKNYYTKGETDSKISTVYKYCGSVNNLSDLEWDIFKLNIGDTYNVLNGGELTVSSFLVNWDFNIVEYDGKFYLKIFENGVDITNKIPEDTITINNMMQDLNILTERGWEVDIDFSPYFSKIESYSFKDGSKTIKCNDGDNVAWTGLTWDNLGGTVDLSDYVTKSGIEEALKTKQDISNMIQTIGDYREDAYPSEKAVQSFVYSLLDEEIVEEDTFPDANIPTSYAVVNYVSDKLSSYETKTTFPDSPTPDDEGRITFDFSDMYNKELRLHTTPSITIIFQDSEYSPDYISGLSFDSGEAPTGFDYTNSGIINWVGTDCVKDGNLSIFQPSANTHYDIIFYFNGAQFIGLVNGFVPATGNG